MMSLWNISQNIAQLLNSKHDVEILKILAQHSLEHRRFIVAIKHGDSSLLFHAIINRKTSIVVYLLENCGADPNSFGFIHGKKITCLAAATLINSSILVNTLLKYHADTEIVFSSDEETVLSYACRMEKVKIAKLLIEYGAKPNHQDLTGKTCLMASTHDLSLIKFLVSAGADVNLADKDGMTCLLLALQLERNEVLTFLLDHESTQIRIGSHSFNDILYYAIQLSSDLVIQQLITKGSYTSEEVAKIYEFACCHYQVTGCLERARELWQKALELRGKPGGTPMFEAPHNEGKLHEVIYLFKADNIPALRFVEATTGFSLDTMFICILAIRYVEDVESYISVCKFFFKEVQSVKNGHFFQFLFYSVWLVECFYTLYNNMRKSHALEMFNLLVNYTKEIYTRLRRMAPQERSIHGFAIDNVMFLIIRCLHVINSKFPENIDWLFNSLKHLIKLDLRGVTQKSLLQKCVTMGLCLVERFFLLCNANVNSSDRLGRAVLHEITESINIRSPLIALIIRHGFDFRAVKYNEYCLPCRLKQMHLLPTPMKYTSLQCLAVKAFCENRMTSFNEVPRHLMPIVKSHLYDLNPSSKCSPPVRGSNYLKVFSRGCAPS